MTTGERIKERRGVMQMSQDELAKAAGYKSRSSINKIESGERDLPLSKILLITKALLTTPTYILGWEDSDDQG